MSLMRGLVSSSLPQNLKRMKATIEDDVASFEKAVDRAERKRSKKADDQDQASRATTNSTSPTFPIHCVNIGESHDFCGRGNELNDLYQALMESHSDAAPVSCVIHGIGGVGKTQTALKFTYKYKSDFEAVFWVSADPEKKTEILRTFGAIGRRLRVFDT